MPTQEELIIEARIEELRNKWRKEKDEAKKITIEHRARLEKMALAKLREKQGDSDSDWLLKAAKENETI